jgi:poly-beta-1,6-N-acetyl-D-glucosamine synthase
MSYTLWIFLISSLAVIYAYVLYPVLLLAIPKRKMVSSQPIGRKDLPWVSVVIPFHNEERWVARKLENALALDYPSSRFQIIAISDGSTDGTNAILEQYKDRVDTVIYHPRAGKPTALNRGVLGSRGEILIFSDANVLIRPDAVHELLGYYSDPNVGGVSGNVVLQSADNAEPLGEGIYMRYERWVNKLESDAGTMVGVDGALFSIRSRLFSPLQKDTIVDDFTMALEVSSKCKRIVYAQNAKGSEVVRPDVQAEFRRKMRMVAGGYQALWRYKRLFNPWKFPLLQFQLWSHKPMRWFVPFFLAAALVSSLLGARQPVLAAAATLQIVFYALALLGRLSGRLRHFRPIYLPYYFCAANIAAVAGLWRSLFRSQAVMWDKVQR